MKYYGTYKGFERFDVCEFNTREELDAWLRGENRFAKEFGIMFPRKELKSKSLIKRMLTNEHVARNVDMDGINWLLYRPAEKTA